MKETYKRPESVLVVITTKTQDVLMLQRVDPSNFWQSVTGSLKWGEGIEEAAWRELHEETGLLPEHGALRDLQRVQRFPILPAWRSRYAPDVSFNTEHVFQFELDQRVPIQLSQNEHSQFRWCDPQEAITLASSYTNRSVIADIFALPDPANK